MFRRFGPNYMALLYLLDLAGGVAALMIAERLRLAPFSTPIEPADARAPAVVYALVVLVFGLVLPLMSLYEARRVFRAVDEAQLVVLSVVASSLVLSGTLYLTYRQLSRLVFIYFAVMAVVLLLSHRLALRVLYRTIRFGTRIPVVLIVGTGALGKQVARALSSAGVRIAGFVDDDPGTIGQYVDGYPVLATLPAIPSIVAEEDATDIVFALPRVEQEHLANVLVELWKLPLRIYTVPDFFDLGFARTQVDYLGGLSVIGLREPVIDGFQRVAKRLLDLVLGTVIFLCALPPMVGIALAIRLESPGPVIFRQRRVGENGHLFTMYKFRTMVADAEQQRAAVTQYTVDGRVIHKRQDDPRVTRLGRLLRRFSLDELPQLVNVLRGEMSLVGPRPEMPWIVDQYDPWQYQRLSVPQGMTSPYVINGRSEIPMHLNTKEDLRYIHDYSILADVKILWKSMGAVLKGRGAY